MKLVVVVVVIIVVMLFGNLSARAFVPSNCFCETLELLRGGLFIFRYCH